MRQVRARAYLALALLNVFVLVAGVVALDLVSSRPLEVAAGPAVPAATVRAPEPRESGIAPAALAGQIDAAIAASGLAGVSGYVTDGATGQALYDLDAETPSVPASTTKVMTAVAALATLGPDARISTEVVQGAGPGEIVLVGAGDPTLTETPIPGGYPRLATLEDLAERTASALAGAGVDTVRLGYDNGLYAGPATGPGWKPGYITEGSVAEVHALMLDGGRVDRSMNYGPRVADPPATAAAAFARRLTAAGIAVEGEPVPAEGGGEPIAAVDSAPVSALVEKMMLESENNIAEALSRQMAIAEGAEPSFAGAAGAVAGVVARLGITGVHAEDGSGLSVNNRITPKALVDLLALAADPERPELAYTLSGLPTGNFTGSLDDRYSAMSGSGTGAGTVRAKTGTLDGVSALAGTVRDLDGNLLFFTFIANDPAAQGPTLDTFAAAIAECGCGAS
ncbi:D-alanyl-D-alanine carboxypeptidase/D-alanyl-D-alanine-endopeptidase [Nocardiopsis sediminis]|uniref:D-alanyl-D-alanine carboxypeptidase/D-alanyl-D-alanine-endopeptidase n=1 Tax=Nocardiopsis sediminis TaxID=1778267 RepID=A0ABV8FWF3_9ACTN